MICRRLYRKEDCIWAGKAREPLYDRPNTTLVSSHLKHPAALNTKIYSPKTFGQSAKSKRIRCVFSSLFCVVSSASNNRMDSVLAHRRGEAGIWKLSIQMKSNRSNRPQRPPARSKISGDTDRCCSGTLICTGNVFFSLFSCVVNFGNKVSITVSQNDSMCIPSGSEETRGHWRAAIR